MIQILGENSKILTHAGLEEDDSLANTNQSKITFYKSFRSYYIVQAFIAS